MLHICCVKAGPRYGPDYVNILFDMVARNLPEGMPGRFVCFTDDPSGLLPGISTEPLPDGLTGWWNKLALFREEAFPKGDRVFYLDLDTCVVGPLDQIVQYPGWFAMQRDFYTEAYGSSIMGWEAGTLCHIWDKWIEAGMPDTPGGDQAWISSLMTDPTQQPDMIEDVYPGCAVSYKRHCQSYPPKGASLVAFHGNPKPHECETEWVKMVWRIGGGTAAEIEIVSNLAEGKIKENFHAACALDIPWLGMDAPHERHAVIVGGAPSVKTKVEELKKWADDGATVFALNNSYQWLIDNGVKPTAQVVLDGREENARFIPEHSSSRHYLCSQCHPAVFERARDLDVVLWHVATEVLKDEVAALTRQTAIIAGGSTVGLNAIAIAYSLGYRKIHIYGMDSSFSDTEHHAYEQKTNDNDIPMDVTCEGRTFQASAWMIAQANQFQELITILSNECDFTVHGTGLIPWIALNLQAAQVPDTDVVEVDGILWPQRDQAMKANTPFAAQHIPHLVNLVRGRKVCVQAGGNVGVWPKLLAEDFERVITFEPDALNWKCMEHNLRDMPNIERHNYALSDRHEEKALARRADNCGAHFIIDGSEFRTTTIDSLQLEACDLIQLDVEGYELPALKGAELTIQKFHPVICIEHNGNCRKYGIEPDDVMNWLFDHGYIGVLKFGRDIVFINEDGDQSCINKADHITDMSQAQTDGL